MFISLSARNVHQFLLLMRLKVKSSYFELESITTNSKTEKDFEKAIKSAFKEIKSDGLNTVTVQVRPCADAFYKSDYFPVSKYCFGVQGCHILPYQFPPWLSDKNNHQNELHPQHNCLLFPLLR